MKEGGTTTSWRRWPQSSTFPNRAATVAAAAAAISRYQGDGRIGVETAQGTVELDVGADSVLADLLAAAEAYEPIPIAGRDPGGESVVVTVLAHPLEGAVVPDSGVAVEAAPSGYRVAAASAVAIAEEFAEVFHCFLQILSGPDAPQITVAEPTVLSELSARRSLALGAGPAAPGKEEQAHQALFRIAAENGAQSAVVDGDTVVSYAELAHLVTTTSRLIQEQGLQRGGVVGVALPRSLASAVAQLSAFNSGCAVALLDPDLPQDRLQFMLSDAGVDLLFTRADAAAATAAADARSVRWLELTTSNRDAAQASPRMTPCRPTRLPDDTVSHIAYTSGSTGTPKAVMLRHGPMSNTALALIEVCGIEPGDRCSWSCAPGVGMVEVDLFPTLSAGGTVVVAPQGIQSDPRANAEWLIRNDIRHSLQATVMAEQLMVLDWPEGTPLRSLRLAGERCRLWPSTRLPFKVINVYGSTEANVVAVTDLNEPTVTGSAASPPIGRAVRNVNIYVLDEHQRPVPHHAVGELCVTGRSLSRGYLNRAEVNAEKFLKNPLPGDPYPVLYRSGDLARFGPDGQLEVVGRVDDEVKVSGFRVHPRDVEAAVCRLEDITGCAVIPRTQGQAGTYLLGYVETAAPVLPAQVKHRTDELRERLGRWLPTYMIPAAFVFRALPVLANGKLDRAELSRLADEDEQALRLLEIGDAPADPWVSKVADIFSDVLGCGAVAADANFFEIGGGSIHATNLGTLLHERFGVSVELADVMAQPTPRAIAALVRATAA